jgi:ankyrin repeat protein
VRNRSMIACPECNADLTKSTFLRQPLWRTCPECNTKLRRYLAPNDRIVLHVQAGFFFFMLMVFFLEGIEFLKWTGEINAGRMIVENAHLYDPFFPFLFSALFFIFVPIATGMFLIRRSVFLHSTDPKVNSGKFFQNIPINIFGTLAGVILAIPIFMFWGVNKNITLSLSSMCVVDEKNPGSYNKLCMNVTRYAIIAGADINFIHPTWGVTPLGESLRMNNHPLTYLLLEQGADVNRADIDGKPPLRWALHDAEMFNLLLENGASSDFIDDDGMNLLQRSIADYDKNNSIKMSILKKLISSGNNVNRISNYGWTPLHYAAQKGHEESTLLLIKHGADLSATSPKDGFMPIHAASNLKTMKLLIQHGSPINRKTKAGENLLHIAARGDSLEMVKFLIDKELPINAPDNYGYSPLHRAHQSNIVLFLLDMGSDVHARAASQIEYNKIVKDKKISPPDPNDLLVRDWTPLHTASFFGRTKNAIDNLVNSGADPRSLTRSGWTPIRLAIRQGNEDVVWAFIERGINISQQELSRHPFIKTGFKKPENPQWTSLHKLASENIPWKVMKELEYDADPDAIDEKGDRPIHGAVISNAKSPVLALIGHGADINAFNGAGQPPLHLAILNGHIDLAELLADVGANVSLKNKNGITPLILALNIQDTTDREKLVGKLKRYGAEE